MAFIYLITNNVNGKQYVGKTCKTTVEKRFKQHIKNTKLNSIYKMPLYSAMNKYGIENFSVSTLEECSSEDSSDRERYWIEKLDTYNVGYNATYGGEGKNTYNYKEISDMYLELGTVKAVTDYFHCDPDTVRKACFEYHIEIIDRTWESKQVVQIDPKNCKIINIFSSLREAALSLGKKPGMSGSICQACKGEHNSALGYYWKYLDDIPIDKQKIGADLSFFNFKKIDEHGKKIFYD